MELKEISVLSTYPPKKCGIGIFASNMVASLRQMKISNQSERKLDIRIIALSDTNQSYKYPNEVSFEVRNQQMADYRRAAEFVNLSGADVVSVQHEFGIFGGEDGDYLLQFLLDLKKPVVTTLHTIFLNPSPSQRQVLKEVCRLSTFLASQSQKGKELLARVYGVPEDKISLVYHGAPDVPFLDPVLYKDKLHAAGRKVVLTFGLLGPNKGIETVLSALPEVTAKFPELLYIVLGTTHPEIKKHYGEEYRLSLQRTVRELDLEKNVLFHNYFVTEEELIQYIVAADIYLTPYLSEEQIVSGTLTYAITCGKAIISTPYYYAREMLAEGRGCLAPFGDSRALTENLCELFGDDAKRNQMRKECYQFGQRFLWHKVAKDYHSLFEKAATSYRPSVSLPLLRRFRKELVLPEVKLDYLLYTLTDDTGLFQHAFLTIPDRTHGYTTDDNARGVVTLECNWSLFKNEQVIPFLQCYLSFIRYAFDDEKRRFRNFMTYNRQFSEEIGSEDSHGRALWAIGAIIRRPPSRSILNVATGLFRVAFSFTASFSSPRAWAYCVIASCYYLERFGGDLEVKNIQRKLVELLTQLCQRNISDDWPWLEDTVTYDNARIPQALIMVGKRFGDADLLQLGLRLIEWLVSVQTAPSGRHLSLVGNNGWLARGGTKAQFDQQPLEVTGLVDACAEAFLATGDETWLNKARFSFQWFLGNNDLNEVLYDSETGGCRDGLMANGVNQNEGAESCLAFLLSLQRLYQLEQVISVQKD
ncbi:MAG: glycosyltransferase family 4 protein [Candidatus Omnitrophota bacterium]